MNMFEKVFAQIKALRPAENRSAKCDFAMNARSLAAESSYTREIAHPASFDKFETRPAAPQNAVDIFAGRWATDLAKLGVFSGGPADHLGSDRRPVVAAELLGKQKRFDGFRILELGPLEGAHTCQLEHLGAAEIVAIEANKEAFFKCLIVKDLAGLQRAKFLFGDFVTYLETQAPRFDLIFCCGVLYHMDDPLQLIHLISKATTRCFVWTHYYEPERCPGRARKPVDFRGFQTDYFVAEYEGQQTGRFWGGPRPSAAWLRKDAILDAFRHFGLGQITVAADDPLHPNGPSFTFVAQA